jgi:hypothetical protein
MALGGEAIGEVSDVANCNDPRKDHECVVPTQNVRFHPKSDDTLEKCIEGGKPLSCLKLPQSTI